MFPSTLFSKYNRFKLKSTHNFLEYLEHTVHVREYYKNDRFCDRCDRLYKQNDRSYDHPYKGILLLKHVVRITDSTRFQIIQKYLHGSSMNEITKEVSISKGVVYKTIEEWRSNLSGINTEDIRIVTTELKKSGLSVQQCVKGFRLAELLKKFGMEDNFDIDFSSQVETTKDRNSQEKNASLSSPNKDLININTKNTEYNNQEYIFNKTQLDEDEIVYFLKNIYLNCKNLGIEPEDVIKWIQDMLNSFRSLEDKEKGFNFSNTSNSVQKADLKIEYEHDPIEKVPYISQISAYLSKKQEQIQQLKKTKSLIIKDIKNLTEQNQNLKSTLDQTIEKEKKIITYYNWYYNLKNELFNNYNMIIDQEFENFAKVIKDFKQYNFDATSILAEYKNINSLKEKRVFTQSQVYQNQTTIERLKKEISSLEDQGNYYRQTIKTYQELHDNGLRLKELKILCNLIMESALENEFDVKDSVKKFFKDVEDHYDDKLGFEKKLQELRKEKEEIENQLPGYKVYLQQQLLAVSNLNYLRSNGVTNTDIININQLVTIFKNNDFLSDPLEESINKSMENSISQIKPNEISHWQRFIEKLQSLKNINHEINRQNTNLNNIKKQTNVLYNNKQLLEKAYADIVINLNTTISKILQSLDLARQIHWDLNKRKIINPVPIVFLVSSNFNSTDNNDTKESEENQ